MTEVPNITLALYAQTHVGMVRAGNEDNFLILDLSSGHSWIAHEDENHKLLTYGQGYYGALLAVSDGMGGALAGEVASRMAVETVRDRMLQLQAHEFYSRIAFHERLRLSIEEANFLINEESNSNTAHRGLGATFTAVATLGDRIYFAQVGDSRAYLLRGGKIARVTKDQSLVQQLIDAGQITEEEAETHQYRNVILQALGAHSTINVEVGSLSLRQYDTLLLCSDGLSGKMHSDEIARIVHSAPDLKSACHELISLANERGGEDNITVVIAQFSGAGLLPPEDREPMVPDVIARPSDIPTRIDLSDGSDRTRPLEQTTTDPGARRSTQQIRTSDAPTPSPSGAPDRAGAGRRGPITAVFGRDDFDDEPEDSAAESQAPTAGAPAETDNGQLRSGTPLDAATEAAIGAAVAPAITSADDPALTAAVKATVRDNPEFRRPESGVSDGFKLTPLKMGMILLLMGLLAGGLILARNYLQGKKQEAERKIQIEELEKNRQEVRSRISTLRGRIDNLRTRLARPTESPRKEELRKQLNDVSAEIDKADALPDDKLAEAKLTLENADNIIRNLEKEIESLSILRSSRALFKIPVHC